MEFQVHASELTFWHLLWSLGSTVGCVPAGSGECGSCLYSVPGTKTHCYLKEPKPQIYG